MRALFILLLLPAAALAAPDEELLGKAEGYPVCKVPAGPVEQRCLVSLFSGYDQALPARRVAKGSQSKVLRRAQPEPDLGADAFMAANRNTGLLVLHGDTILAERYNYERKPEHRFASMSVAKTLVAMLVGIALHEKHIASIDDRADKYVPELKGHPYGETSLRHLLTMSSGVKFTERYDGTDDMMVLVMKTFYQQGPGGVDTILSFRERAGPAGEKWSYASTETQVLGLVLRAATGKPLADYLSEKIWQPMGAEADASWNIDAGGFEMAFCCINATLRDWARVGMLLANDGALDGRQIIPAAWVRAATTAEARHLWVGNVTPRTGYGYQTWLLRHPRGVDARRFALFGVRGQTIVVDPETRTVVVHTAVHARQRDDAARTAQIGYSYEVVKKLQQP